MLAAPVPPLAPGASKVVIAPSGLRIKPWPSTELAIEPPWLMLLPLPLIAVTTPDLVPTMKREVGSSISNPCHLAYGAMANNQVSFRGLKQVPAKFAPPKSTSTWRGVRAMPAKVRPQGPVAALRVHVAPFQVQV